MNKGIIIALLFAISFSCEIDSQLIISELYCSVNSDPILSKEKYVEIFNPMDCTVDLTGWEIRIISNCVECGTTDLTGLDIDPNQTLRFTGPNATINSDLVLSNFNGSCYGTWNGQKRDGIRLMRCGEIVDQFQPDCTTTSYFQNQRLIRNSDVCNGAQTFNASNWSLVSISSIAELPVNAGHSTTCSKICGYWTGEKDDNWHDCANWSDRKIPDTGTPVTIDQDYINPCTIYLSDAVCESLNISSNASTDKQGLAIFLGKKLTVQDDVQITKTGGTEKLSLIIQNGELEIGGNFEATMSSPFTSKIEIYLSGSSSNQFIASDISLINASPLVGSQVSIELQSDGGTIETNDLVLSGNGEMNSAKINVLYSTPIANKIDVNNSIFIQNGGFLNHAFGEISLAQNFFDTNLTSGYETNSATIILDGNASQIISTNDLLNLYDLTLSKSSGEIIMQGDVEIENILDLGNDYINLNNCELIISNSSSNAISRTSGGIISESNTFESVLSWKIGFNPLGHEFPFITDMGGTYIPFTFKRTSGNAGTVSISTYGTSSNNLPFPPGVSSLDNISTPGNPSEIADRWWYINPQNDSGLSADMTFSWSNSESPNGVGTPNAQRFNESSSLWEIPIDPTPVFGTIAGSEYLTIQGATSFSPWGVARPNAPLPVELISFDVWKDNQDAVLEWKTASETNSYQFIIERANDMASFIPIGEVHAAGFSEEQNNYEFRDTSPYSGINYYRLKQVDFDGTYEYSDTRSISFGDQIEISSITDGYMVESSDPIEVKLSDLSGRYIINKKGTDIEIKSLSPGVYILQICSGSRHLRTVKLFFE